MKMCFFLNQNDPLVLNISVLVQSIIITLIYLLALFSVQNFKKKFLQQIQSYADVPFLGPKCFWKKLLIQFSSMYRPLSLSKIFTKFLQQTKSLEDAPILSPKWPIGQMRIFSENLLISLFPFIHAYLHAKNQSMILIY